MFDNATVQRWGCCDPKIDSGRTIVNRDGRFYLVQEQHGEGFSPVEDFAIPDNASVANGYYDHEHDEWLPVEEYWEKYLR